MRHHRPVTLAAIAALVTAGTVSAVALATPASAASSTLVVNEAYGGGGNSGAPLHNDFIELANRGTGSASVEGWSVQYLSATPNASSQWSVTVLTGTVTGGALYLIGEGAGNGGGDPLPPTQATGSLAMSGSAGTVALANSATPLTCLTAADCAADPSVVDLVGYGGAVVHEGTASAPGTSNTMSAQRTADPDTDQNGTDFTVAAPTPGAANATGGGTGTGNPGPLRIHDVQSAAWVSPHAGDTVTNVPGIVTGLRTSGSSKGYWIQDPTPDTDPATSEGIFVYTGSAPPVSVGDSVLVSGTVSDYYPLSSGETVATTSNLSTTEIGTSTVIVLSHANALPAPIVLTPATVPDTYAPDLNGGNIEDTPITPARSALDYYESIEGMRVEVDNARVVGPSNQYGEQYVTTKPAQNATYRGGTEILAENATPSGRLEVVTTNGSNLGLDVGDVLTGATIGQVDWSSFGGYSLDASTVGTPQHNHLAPVVATPATRKQLSVATYNVENLAPGDSAAKYAALGQGVVTNLGSPDIVALEEVQDNTGATDDGTVAADRTLAKLVAAIEAAGGPTYQWREIDPVNDKDGGQPGGNIRVAFLFDPSRVSFVDTGKSTVDRSTTGTQVVKSHGKPALTLSPGRIDPGNPVWSDSRKPLAGQFRFNGKDVVVIANHFDSKLGDQNADGRFQYPEQSSTIQRAGQALVVHDFVNSILAVDKKAQVVVLGDLNDYQFSPSVAVLKTGTSDGSGASTLTDLITTLPANQQYTYVYDGISQVLDHILVTAAVRHVDYQVVHVNAEYTNQTSDHDPQVLAFTP
ncbi:MAG: endonuclease/exonuclease/phosphatase family protein [Jatrophihabitantaceae bacterium]